eukprot:COSAG01_NODE_20452_length_952_cov_1.607268_1_plen_87_part_10
MGWQPPEATAAAELWRVVRDDGVVQELEADRIMAALSSYEEREEELLEELRYALKIGGYSERYGPSAAAAAAATAAAAAGSSCHNG